MRKLFNFGILSALFLSFLSVGACSNSDDDDIGSPTVIKGKRLMKVRCTSENFMHDSSVPDSVLEYVYNSKGEIIRDHPIRFFSSTFAYTDRMISYDNMYYYILENGRVARDSTSWYRHSYEYDSRGQLTSLKEIDSSSSITLTWRNGNIDKVEYGGSVCTLTYTSHPNTLPTLNPVADLLYRDGHHGTIWGQGYMGKVCQNLPATMTVTESDLYDQSTETTTYTYDYTFTDGVPTQIIEQRLRESYNTTYIWQLTWE